MNDTVREALSKVGNVEFLDLDSFKLAVEFSPEVRARLMCDFDRFVLALRNLRTEEKKSGFIDLEATLYAPGVGTLTYVASAAFTVGYNPDTRKPQLIWHDGEPPSDVDLCVAVDVVIGCLFAVLSTLPEVLAHPAMEQIFPKGEPILRRVK